MAFDVAFDVHASRPSKRRISSTNARHGKSGWKPR